MAGSRSYDFLVAVETSTTPTATTPTVDADIVNKGYADDIYARRFSWWDSTATVAAVRAIAVADRAHGQLLFCQALSKIFYFDSASVAVDDGTTIIEPTVGTGAWLQMPGVAIGSEYAAIVSSPASSISTHTTISSAITAVSAGSRILVQQGTYTETVTINKQLYIEGAGYMTVISGNVSVTSASDFSKVENFKITGTVTLNVGAEGNVFRDCALDSLVSWIDNDGSNYFEGMEF